MKKDGFPEGDRLLCRRENRGTFAFRHGFQEVQHVQQNRNPQHCCKQHGYRIPYGAVTERRDERAAEVVDAVENHAEPDTPRFQQDDRAHPADEERIPRLKQDGGRGHSRNQIYQMDGGEHGGGEDGRKDGGTSAERTQDVRKEEAAERQFLEQSDGSGLQDEKKNIGDSRVDDGRAGEQPDEREIVDRYGCGGKKADEGAAVFRHAEDTSAAFPDQQEKQCTAGGTREDGADHFVPERAGRERRAGNLEDRQDGGGGEQDDRDTVRTFHVVPSVSG